MEKWKLLAAQTAAVLLYLLIASVVAVIILNAIGQVVENIL